MPALPAARGVARGGRGGSPSRYATEEYWARPLPGFGNSDASVLMIGLAPAAHGGNGTGKIFTGDRSGDFLFDSLYRTGFANQPTSIAPDDGLTVSDLYIAAVVRCAPPDNQPLPLERDCCPCRIWSADCAS